MTTAADDILGKCLLHSSWSTLWSSAKCLRDCFRPGTALRAHAAGRLSLPQTRQQLRGRGGMLAQRTGMPPPLSMRLPERGLSQKTCAQKCSPALGPMPCHGLDGGRVTMMSTAGKSCMLCLNASSVGRTGAEQAEKGARLRPKSCAVGGWKASGWSCGKKPRKAKGPDARTFPARTSLRPLGKKCLSWWVAACPRKLAKP